MEESGGGPKHPQQLFFDNVSPATRLLEKRRQMYEVQDALENQKNRFMKDEEQFRKKEEQLRAKDLQLQHQLFRFNKFLQDNEAKRRRAETRAAEEAAQIRSREEEIQDLEKQLEEGERQRANLEDEVSRNMKYEEFLERVKDTCDDYQEIQDLVTRYDTLESANKDLMDLQQASNQRIEELRNNFRNYSKEQQMDMLELTNRIASLSQELDDSQKERHLLEQHVDKARQDDSKHSLYFGRILMSVENLFLRCTTKRANIRHDDEFSKARDGAEADGEHEHISMRELKVIMAYIKDFKSMVEQLRKTDRDYRAQTQQGRQAGPETVRPAEPKINVETLEQRPGERGSQNSGSQGNTKDLQNSRNVQNSGGSGGGGAAVTD
jgi:septal ring factor EnvC (AmiA/AmiB activator)